MSSFASRLSFMYVGLLPACAGSLTSSSSLVFFLVLSHLLIHINKQLAINPYLSVRQLKRYIHTASVIHTIIPCGRSRTIQCGRLGATTSCVMERSDGLDDWRVIPKGTLQEEARVGRTDPQRELFWLELNYTCGHDASGHV